MAILAEKQSACMGSASSVLCTENHPASAGPVKRPGSCGKSAGCCLILFFEAGDAPRHVDAACRCMREGVGDAAAVSDDIEPRVLGLQMLVQRHFHIIELHLDAIEKRVVICRTRRNLIELIDHLDDAVQNPLGQNQTEIAGRRRQRRADESLCDPLGVGTAAAHEVAEPLDDHAAAEHVRQARDALAIAIAVLERFGEMLGHEQGEVCVFGLLVRALVAVPVDGHDAVGVLVDDDAVRIHAECADIVLELLRAVHNLALIQLIGQIRENDGGQFDADADVDAVGLRRNVHLVADAFHPFAAAAADGDNALPALVCFLLRGHAETGIQMIDVGNRCVEIEVNMVLQLVVEMSENDIINVRAEVADGGIEQFHPVLQTELLEVRAGGRVELCPFAAVLHVDRVHVLHERRGFVAADILIQRSAKIVRDVVFPIGEGTGSAEAAHDRAGLAVNAVLDLHPIDRAFAAGELVPLIEDGDRELRILLHQLIGRIDASGAGTDDDDIVIFHR